MGNRPQKTTVAIIGGGVIGSGWAARLLLNGINVQIYDPQPQAEKRLQQVLANAKRTWSQLTMLPMAELGQVSICSSMVETVNGATFIEECTPEDKTLKCQILEEIDAIADRHVTIGSSTSGLLPTQLQSRMRYPERFLVTHPFNPVYLLPLVELCGGQKTAAHVIDETADFLQSIGMQPLKVSVEIDGFIADRLLEAIWREALWLVHDNIATAEEIDDALRFGAGLRFALMGPFLTYRLAGGEAGMRHFMAQFGPALQLPWTKLTDVPHLSDTFLDKIVEQSDRQAGGQSIHQLERRRDDVLVAILKGLKAQDWGAGNVLQHYEQQLSRRFHQRAATHSPDYSKPLCLHQGEVLPEWIDYNGHMTESRYLQVLGDATDAVLGHLGFDSHYLASGRSLYTAETHIRHLQEIKVSNRFRVETQILSYDEKRLHLWHALYDNSHHTLSATGEHMLLHVDTVAGKVSPMGDNLYQTLCRIGQAHQQLPRPVAAGRSISVLSNS